MTIQMTIQMQNDEPTEEVVLSRRNKKRFDKLVAGLDKKIIDLEQQNAVLRNNTETLKDQIQSINSVELIEKKEILSEYDKAHKDYLDAQADSEETERELSKQSSSMSEYGTEIIWFSVVIGLVFDFLLWKDIFAGKFGSDSWAERAERASAIILSFSYAFVCAQLGASYAIKTLSSKRRNSTNPKEIEIYNKSTAKNSLGINVLLFSLLTVLSTSARYAEEGLDMTDKFILSLASVSIGLVISAIAYWYTDVYDHFIKAVKKKEEKARKNFYSLNKQIKESKYEN
jgi:uncharacterized protein YeeX (DUF496 family)